jgi:hypothetical protein
VFDLFHLVVESYNAVGDTYNEIESKMSNLAALALMPIGIMTVDTIQGQSYKRRRYCLTRDPPSR